MDNLDLSVLYRLLDNVTPLPVDCGRLCGAKCCTDWEKGVGVYLLPGEEELFMGQDWCELVEILPEDAPFSGERCFLLRCREKCPREKRPLLCRTFPLAPYTGSDGVLQVVFDEDGWLVCPLVKLGDMEQLDYRFVKRVLAVWEKLAEHEVVRSYIQKYSARIDSDREKPWRRLFGV